MLKYAGKRLLLLIPTLFLVCLIIFVLMRMIPGSAVDRIVYNYSTMGVTVDAETVKQNLGLDKPALVQFVNWVAGLIRGDLGDSLFQTESVGQIISTRLPATLELGALILLFANLISIPLGLYCAARQDSITDNSVRIISVILMSVPLFWIAALVLVYPAVWWKYAPPSTYVGFFENPIQNLRMFLVPALLGAFTTAGGQIRMVRSLALEVLRQDYVRTGWSKGAGEKRILFGHTLRNTMIPVITLIGGSVGGLIGGSVILENMFNIPGIGQQLVSALNNRDYPLVQGCTLIFSLVVMLVNLLVDLAYKWIDPRVELE